MEPSGTDFTSSDNKELAIKTASAMLRDWCKIVDAGWSDPNAIYATVMPTGPDVEELFSDTKVTISFSFVPVELKDSKVE